MAVDAEAIVRNWAPPILLRKLLLARKRSQAFVSFDAASQTGATYEHRNLVELVVAKGALFREKMQRQPTLGTSDLRILLGSPAHQTRGH